MNGDDLAAGRTVELAGGTPQGDPLAAIIWVVVHNLSILLGKECATDGPNVHEEDEGYQLHAPDSQTLSMSIIAYADDTKALARSVTKLERRVQGLALGGALNGVSLNGQKCVFSSNVTNNNNNINNNNNNNNNNSNQPPTLSIYALNANGRFVHQPLKASPPHTPIRDLGVFFQRAPEKDNPAGRWAAQLKILEGICDNFIQQ